MPPDCADDDQWVIQAPKLWRFHVADVSNHEWQINVPYLEKGSIECDSDYDFINLIIGLVCAKTLLLLVPRNAQ
ncbi:hypothetical protein ACP70R_014840 [Stipagrostis hirtigluma subsp. patula]